MTEPSAVAAVARAFARIAAAERPEVWITLLDEKDVARAASEIDARVSAGEVFPLAGWTFAVKDNIDVAGLETTAACPAYAYVPAESATVVDRLRGAGAVLIGKTNMDQFATGLVGTRSPYGKVRNAWHPEHISGGSSSGSGVAVALGFVRFALGTDTAGSGRVPAACNEIVGLKPTRGIISAHGVVPACRSLDCVSVFAQTCQDAAAVLDVAAGFDPRDAWSRESGVGPAAPLSRVGHAPLASVGETARAAYGEALSQLESLGHPLQEVDMAPLFAAAALLYGGALVAERYAAVGEFVDAHPGEVDPIVGSIISAAGAVRGSDVFADQDRLVAIRRQADAMFDRIDVLVLPTIERIPTIADVDADPIGVNTALGRYTNFVNPLDLAAVAVPAGVGADGLPFGVTFIGPAFADAALLAVAASFRGEAMPASAALPSRLIPIAVVGAHLSAQPLNHQLLERNARLVTATTTAPVYRLHFLPTTPPKPGMVRVTEGGAAIRVEVWELDAAGFGSFVAAIPAPLGIGKVELADGSSVAGFLCEPYALEGTDDITSFGGWLAFLASR